MVGALVAYAKSTSEGDLFDSWEELLLDFGVMVPTEPARLGMVAILVASNVLPPPQNPLNPHYIGSGYLR
jgi:hypothetical protein